MSNQPHDQNASSSDGYYSITRWSALVPEQVGSREVRYLAVAELIESGRAMTAMELQDVIESRGMVFWGQGNKVVADALRWEVAKGRVIKPARGWFRVGTMPRSTKAWIRGRARTHYALVAGAPAA